VAAAATTRAAAGSASSGRCGSSPTSSSSTTSQLARILDELKTERAQVAVDDRRTPADFADALAGHTRAGDSPPGRARGRKGGLLH